MPPSPLPLGPTTQRRLALLTIDLTFLGHSELWLFPIQWEGDHVAEGTQEKAMGSSGS